MKNSLTKNQCLWTIAIVLVGAVLAVLILFKGGSKPAVEAKEQGHSDKNSDAAPAKTAGAQKPASEKPTEKPADQHEEKAPKIVLDEMQVKAAGIAILTLALPLSTALSCYQGKFATTKTRPLMLFHVLQALSRV